VFALASKFLIFYADILQLNNDNSITPSFLPCPRHLAIHEFFFVKHGVHRPDEPLSCSLELISSDTAFFSHNKTTLVGLSVAETIIRTARL
jgi:hypothetical protein